MLKSNNYNKNQLKKKKILTNYQNQIIKRLNYKILKKYNRIIKMQFNNFNQYKIY